MENDFRKDQSFSRFNILTFLAISILYFHLVRPERDLIGTTVPSCDINTPRSASTYYWISDQNSRRGSSSNNRITLKLEALKSNCPQEDNL